MRQKIDQQRPARPSAVKSKSTNSPVVIVFQRAIPSTTMGLGASPARPCRRSPPGESGSAGAPGWPRPWAGHARLLGRRSAVADRPVRRPRPADRGAARACRHRRRNRSSDTAWPLAPVTAR